MIDRAGFMDELRDWAIPLSRLERQMLAEPGFFPSPPFEVSINKSGAMGRSPAACVSIRGEAEGSATARFRFVLTLGEFPPGGDGILHTEGGAWVRMESKITIPVPATVSTTSKGQAVLPVSEED